MLKLLFYCVDQTKLDCIFVFADFISCLPPEKPRNIALIYSISLKRVQRWRVSLIRSANDKNNRLSCLYANMSLLFSFNSNMKNILEIYVFSEWITTQYYVFFFLLQILILALMCIALDLESAGPTVRMTLSVSAMTNAPHIKTQCALRTEQLTTTDAGIS